MTLNLSPQTEAKLTLAAYERGIDIATLIELAVDHLPPIETADAQEAPTLLERFGHLFDAVQAGPGNRAEHPENYMEGFGLTNAV